MFSSVPGMYSGGRLGASFDTFPLNFTFRITAIPSGSFFRAERTDFAEMSQSLKISRKTRLKVSMASHSLPPLARTIFSPSPSGKTEATYYESNPKS